MSSEKPIIVMAAAVVALMLMGEAFVLCFDGSSYGAACSRDGDTISYSVTTAGADTYGVTAISGSHVDEVYIYVDDAYGSESVRGSAPVGSFALTPSRFSGELTTILSERGFYNVRTVDAAGLGDLCKDVSSASGKGVVCVSGLLPDTVYDGTSSSPVLKWLSAGGSLYWAGNVIGAYVGHSGSDTTSVTDGYKLFLGESSSIPVSSDAYGSTTVGNLTDVLGLRGNGIDYAPVISSLVDPLTSGYSDGQRSSVTFVHLGSGQVCVMGGGLVFNHYRDLSQLICGGVSVDSELLSSSCGDVVRGTVSGALTVPASADVTVYVFLGKGTDNTVFGRVFAEVHG